MYLLYNLLKYKNYFNKKPMFDLMKYFMML